MLLTKIKLLRKEKGISQKTLAEMIGVEQSAYSKIECGKTHLNVNTFLRICEVLQVPPEELLPSVINNNN